MQESEEEKSLAEMADEASITISAHEKDVFCVDLFGDRWLASGGEDDRALLFDLTISGMLPHLIHVISLEQSRILTYLIYSFCCRTIK